MKRFLKVFLAIIFVASLFLVACSNNSNDPKVHVGAVLVNPNGEILGNGSNNFVGPLRSDSTQLSFLKKTPWGWKSHKTKSPGLGIRLGMGRWNRQNKHSAGKSFGDEICIITGWDT